jgi:hypothetical protein
MKKSKAELEDLTPFPRIEILQAQELGGADASVMIWHTRNIFRSNLTPDTPGYHKQ